MTSSTSNSELACSRTGILKVLKSALPFALVFAALNMTMPLWALKVGERYKSCNEPKNGAAILASKSRFESGDFPRGYDILFAGTSRTMGDVSAAEVAREFEKALPAPRALKAYNMGYIGRSVTLFERTLRGDRVPALLVFEFHPLLLMNDLTPEKQAGAFQKYRVWSEISELKISGGLAEIFGHGGIVRPGPLSFKGIAQTYIKKTKTPVDLYYYHRDRLGYCQKLQPDGHVTYRNFLKDREQAAHVRTWYSAAVEHSTLTGRSIDPKAWRAFEALVKRLAPEGRLIVARMPIDPENNMLENTGEKEIIDKTRALLRQYGVPYIDMNPNEKYYTSDTSHLDWYDTAAFSKALAGEMLEALDREKSPLFRHSR